MLRHPCGGPHEGACDGAALAQDIASSPPHKACPAPEGTRLPTAPLGPAWGAPGREPGSAGEAEAPPMALSGERPFGAFATLHALALERLWVGVTFTTRKCLKAF